MDTIQVYKAYLAGYYNGINNKMNETRQVESSTITDVDLMYCHCLGLRHGKESMFLPFNFADFSTFVKERKA
jgi:hypothetical protein